MTDGSMPWNILMGYAGAPQPSGPRIDAGNLMSQYAANVSNFDGIPLNPGVPAPQGDAARLVQCMVQTDPTIINRLNSTSEYYAPRSATDPHYSNQAVDILTNDPVKAMILGAICGAPFHQNEYTHPSANANGAHVHLQTRPGLGGATRPYYPPPRPIPRPDYP